MKEMLIRMPSVCLITLLWLGCAHTVTVDVKGTQKTEAAVPSHVTYAVLPTNEVENDRAFPDYAKLTTKQLEDRDYKQTDAKVAKLGVYLAYGVSERAAGPTASSSPQNMGSAGGTTPGSGTLGYGMVGSSPNAATAQRYTTQVVLVVIDLPKSRAAGSLVELWRGETIMTGSSNDLPRMAPILIEAAFRHFGETTPNKVQHTFGDDDVKKLQEAR
ncbi:MAG: DUF4136 domain-containing protein [Nitrospiraceae bacterium]